MTESAVYSDAQRAIKYGFLFMGVPIGMLIPRLAEIKLGLHAGDSSYGTAIALGGLGALSGNYLGARLVHHFGSKPIARAAFIFFLLANISNALVPSITWLAVAAFSGGTIYSLINIAMNSQGTLVEQAIGRSFMPKGHGFWSIGTLVAAFISSLAAPHITPLTALFIGGTVSLIGFEVVTRTLLPMAYDDRPHDDPTQLPRTEKVPRTTLRFLFVIAVAQWLGMLAEISVGDWSSVLLHEFFAIPIGPNGYAFTAFMLVQLVSRLTSPKLIDKHGLPTVIKRMGYIGATGFLIFLFLANHFRDSSHTTIVILCCIAYGFMALGVANMPPAFVSAAARIPGLPSARALMITGVTLAILNMIGRVTLGVIAQAFTLPLALSLTGIALIIAATMTKVLDPERAKDHAIRR